MGFSRRLMPLYQAYSSTTGSWNRIGRGGLLDAKGRFVISPAVRQFASRHFNCSRGLPLSRRKRRLGRTAWDSGFMLSSIMAADLVSPSATAVDAGSLALLQDSGWYRPNYALADPMLWGRRAGCRFARRCENTHRTEFCTPNSSAAIEPDYFRRIAGTCRQLTGSRCYAILPTVQPQLSDRGGRRHRRRSQCSGQWHSMLVPGRSGEFRSGCVKVDCQEPNRVRRSWSSRYRWFQPYQATWRSFRNISAVISSCPATGGPDNQQPGIVCAPAWRVCPQRSTVWDLLTSFHLWRELLVEAADTLNSLEDLFEANNSEEELSSNSEKKFKLIFTTFNYDRLQLNGEIAAFKILLQLALADAFSTDTDYIHILEVRSGSVVVIWQNLDPNMDIDTKTQLIQALVSSGKFAIRMNGVLHSASSVEEYSSTNYLASFPLTEAVIGGAVGGLMLLGLILIVAVLSVKYSRPRQQVRPDGATQNGQLRVGVPPVAAGEPAAAEANENIADVTAVCVGIEGDSPTSPNDQS